MTDKTIPTVETLKAELAALEVERQEAEKAVKSTGQKVMAAAVVVGLASMIGGIYYGYHKASA